LGLLIGPAAAIAAHADDYVGTNTTVKGNEVERNPKVLGSEVSRGLAVTGGDLAEIAVIGLGAIGAGTVLVRRSRRATA
jgi:hypothetical protein